MIEEDIVLLFSSNKNFLDLVLTFKLEIDYGADQESTHDEGDIESSSEDMGSVGGVDYTEDKEERACEEEADCTVHGLPDNEGDSGVHSQADGGGETSYSIAFAFDDRRADGVVRRPEV